MEIHAKRRQKLRRLFDRAKVDGLLVTNFTNVTYLTGFTGDDSYLLVTGDGEVILSDARYTTQLSEECPDVRTFIRGPGQTMLSTIRETVAEAKIERLGIEGGSMTVGIRDHLDQHLDRIDLVTTYGLVEELRAIKDKSEVDAIRLAIGQAQRGFAVFRAILQPQMTEKELADELEYQMRKFGAKDRAFPSIVAAGPRAALPHAVPTDGPIGEQTSLLIDWGAQENLYRSDLTRVLTFGRPPAKFRKIYETVLEAQMATIGAIQPGMTGGEADAVARDVITKAGFGKRFEHGTGHGLGLDVHEGPRLGKGCQTVLKPGMVVTVEPGIYLPGWGGVRIEDDVLITRTGCEVLSSYPKGWDDTISEIVT